MGGPEGDRFGRESQRSVGHVYLLFLFDMCMSKKAAGCVRLESGARSSVRQTFWSPRPPENFK